MNDTERWIAETQDMVAVMSMGLTGNIRALGIERLGLEHLPRALRLIARLRPLLSRTRTGTRPDGSPCWCDLEEAAVEYEDEPGAAGHTALCREITEALR